MNKKVLPAYLKSRIPAIVSGVCCVCVTALVLWLYGEPMTPVLLCASLLLVLGVIFGIIGYRRFSKKHEMLSRALPFPQNFAETLSPTEDEDASGIEEKIGLIEKDYQLLLFRLAEELQKEKEESSSSRNAMLDYYTMWVHQIKTPISAMSLIIQNMEDQETANRLDSQLMHVRNYADMALHYLRLGSESNDLVFEKVEVDEVLRSGIKRAMTMFLCSELSVDFVPTKLVVTTDKKWLGFIVDQLISNAVKYQKKGTVHFYGDDHSFTIEDEGIGIAKEDLPRIFEKGYTGYNGHNEKQSSGLGLYLVKKAADMISADVVFTSEVGKGTKVQVLFDKKE
ncbi:MAG: sensor histidine kinase [Clostridiales bacterium]|nr:sensor histidine kinase [Clostridiales bacterium]